MWNDDGFVREGDWFKFVYSCRRSGSAAAPSLRLQIEGAVWCGCRVNQGVTSDRQVALSLPQIKFPGPKTERDVISFDKAREVTTVTSYGNGTILKHLTIRIISSQPISMLR